MKQSKINAWSFSRYKDYEKCPAYAKYKHLDKLPEPKHPAMQRGIDIAKAEEDYFRGVTSRVPAEIHDDLKTEFRRIKKQKDRLVEEQWGFTAKWQPTGWFDWNNCWLRVKIDVGYRDGTTVYAYDNKTGGVDKRTGKLNMYAVEDYEMQLDLYGIATLCRFPDVEVVRSRLLYTDLGITYPAQDYVKTRADLPKGISLWTKRTKAMLSDTKFPPKPGQSCMWCAYSKAKGGPCKY